MEAGGDTDQGRGRGASSRRRRLRRCRRRGRRGALETRPRDPPPGADRARCRSGTRSGPSQRPGAGTRVAGQERVRAPSTSRAAGCPPPSPPPSPGYRSTRRSGPTPPTRRAAAFRPVPASAPTQEKGSIAPWCSLSPARASELAERRGGATATHQPRGTATRRPHQRRKCGTLEARWRYSGRLRRQRRQRESGGGESDGKRQWRLAPQQTIERRQLTPQRVGQVQSAVGQPANEVKLPRWAGHASHE